MPIEDSEGFTKLAFGPQQQPGMPQQTPGIPNSQDTSVYAEFYLHPVENKAKSAEEGRPIYDEVEFVRIMVPGDKTSMIERPVRIGNFPKNDNHRFASQYAAFKQGLDQNVSGTPLKEWAAISRSQVKELEFFNCRTVEQLAEMPDTAVQNFTGVANLRELARKFIEEAKDGSAITKMQAELEERDKKIAALEAAVAELGEDNKEGGRKRRKVE